jgi:flagellar assembly factor FliW
MTAALPVSLPDSVEIVTQRFGSLTVPMDMLVHFPEGLPGFEMVTNYVLLPVRKGVAWLQSADIPALAFLMVDAESAGAGAAVQGWWAIVTLGTDAATATANLLAPIWIDQVTATGRQVIRAELGASSTHPVDLSAI